MTHSYTNNHKTVLGIGGALNHDASVSIVKGNEILFAAHSERYSKIKNDPLLNSEIIHNALENMVYQMSLLGMKILILRKQDNYGQGSIQLHLTWMNCHQGT